MERDELRVELSIMHQREQKIEQKNKVAQLDVLEGINGFEATLLKTTLNTHSNRLKDAELLEATQVPVINKALAPKTHKTGEFPNNLV